MNEIRIKRGTLHVVDQNGAKVIHNESGCPLNHQEIQSLPFDGNSALFDVEIVLTPYPNIPHGFDEPMTPEEVEFIENLLKEIPSRLKRARVPLVPRNAPLMP